MKVFQEMCVEELEEMQKAIAEELKSRKEARALELKKDLLAAVQALKKEFPYASCEYEVECEEGYHTIDLIAALSGVQLAEIHHH